MATGVLGLGTGQAAALNNDLIDKLKTAERASTVAPIETSIEDIASEKEMFSAIQSKVSELLSAIKPFDLFVTGGATAFESKSATTSGDSVVFDAADVSLLNIGVTNVEIFSLAQKDVFQSNKINSTDVSSLPDLGVLSIKVGTNDTLTFDTNEMSDIDPTKKKYETYEALTKAISAKTGVYASFEKVDSSSYRMIIKSENSGIDNALTITGDAAYSLGFPQDVYTSNTISSGEKNASPNIGTLTISSGGDSFDFDTSTYNNYDELATAINAQTGLNASLEGNDNDGYKLVLMNTEIPSNELVISGTANTTLGYTTASTVNTTNHTLTAKNMDATVDGVSYSVSSNTFSVDGLKVTGTKEGKSSIDIVKDNTQITSSMKNFVTLYNELVATIDDATSADSPISNKTGLRDIVSQVKEKLFGTYGDANNKSLFNNGFELDEYGILSLDEKKFNDLVENDLDGLKDLFIGTADETKRGFGTQLKEILDSMNFTGGAIKSFESLLTTRETSLTAEKEKAEEALNTKYEQLALQFASYGSIITQFESSFSGLKLMIEESVSSS